MPRGRARPPTPGDWGGTLLLRGGFGLYTGRAFATTPHAHHALQVCVGLDGRFRLRGGARLPWRRYRGAIVPSDQPHALDGGGRRVALLYVDAESVAARTIACRAARAGIAPLPVVTLRALLARLRLLEHTDTSAALTDELLEVLVPEGRVPARLDARVARALELLRAAPERRMPLRELAAAVGLSPNRLGHVFRAHMGLPVRRYLLWLRLGDALQRLARGVSLTAAAHAAGFADSAHFSRTFRRMLGITPSALHRHGEFVQDALARPS